MRVRLAAALRRSSLAEGKSHLQRFFGTGGRALGEAIGESALLGRQGWLQRVLTAPDAEIYFPVAEHRTWDGLAPVLVMAVTHDERWYASQGHYTAFDMTGGEIRLSIETPPRAPVIVLHPVERPGIFPMDGQGAAGPQLLDDPPGGGGGGGPNYCDGIRATDRNINICEVVIDSVGSYEGWPRGAPEVSIRLELMHTDVGASQAYYPDACVNEDQPSPRYYNQDNDTWTGSAFLIVDSLLKASISPTRRPALLVWEDDGGSKCSLKVESWSDSLVTVYGFGGGFLTTLLGFVPNNPQWLVGLGATVGLYSINVLSGSDDLIGTVASVPADSMGVSRTIYRAVSSADPTLVARGTITFHSTP